MLPELQHSGPEPLYAQIKSWIRQQISQGTWPEYHKLSSETDIAQQLNVSRGTVRKAITELTQEGWLVRRHGLGTFVASTQLEQSLAQHLITISEDLIRRNIPFTTQVIDQAIIQPPEHVQEKLQIPADGRVFFLSRVRYVAEKPLVLLHNYVVYERCVGIEEMDFSRYRLFEVLEEHYGLTLDRAKRLFMAQAADAYTADMLAISECDAVMKLEQQVLLADGSPIELSDVWMPGDGFRLSASVKRDRRLVTQDGPAAHIDLNDY